MTHRPGHEDASTTGGSGVDPGFKGVNPPTDVASGYSGSSGADAKSMGVWYLRPKPLPVYVPSTTNDTQMAAYDQKANWAYYTPSQLQGAYQTLDDNPGAPFGTAVFEAIAKAGSKRKTGSGLFGDLIKEAERQNADGDNKVSVFSLAYDLAKRRGLVDENGQWVGGSLNGSGSGRGSGRSAAANLPVVRRFGEDQIVMMANDTAMQLVGRELNKRELRAIIKDVRLLESENPETARVVGGVLEQSGGVSAALLQDVIQERAGQIATKGLDAAGPLNADAAKQADALRQWAKANGIGLSDSAISNYTRKVLLGETTLDDVKGDLRRTYLAGMYPAWSDKIAAGEDPSDFLSPYVSAAQTFLERKDIGMDDPLVQRMTQYTDQSGKPAVMPLWQAAQVARKDDRWQYTNNAQAEYGKAAESILKMFGFR